MSHFSVLVIGPDPDKQLAPYHEFECTGTDDEFVQTIDVTDDARTAYLADTETLLLLPDGTRRSQFDEKGQYIPELLREPTAAELKGMGPLAGGSGGNSDLQWTSHDWNDGRGYRTKIVTIPKGWTEIEVPTPDVKSFASWVGDYYGFTAPIYRGEFPDLTETHKYGYVQIDRPRHARAIAVRDEGGVATLVDEAVRVFDRTNPRKKWDWYTVGGRWRGFFQLKPGTTGTLGEPGTFERLDGAYSDYVQRADTARKGDIDFATMRAQAADKAAQEWDKVHAVIDQHPPITPWETIRTHYQEHAQIQAARDAYHGQAGLVALRASNAFMWDVDEYLVPRDTYVDAAAAGAATTFAIVKDGAWYERGEMGWWGIVSDEKDRAEWGQRAQTLLNDLPDDTLLTVVDCHI